MSDATPGRVPNRMPQSECTRAVARPRTHIFDAPTIRSFDAPREVTNLLEAAVDQANIDARRLEHMLICGPAGSGKQVLARAVVRELAQHAAEIDGECIENLEHLMELVRLLRARDVLLIRNLDRMAKRGQRNLAVMLSERLAPRSARPVRPRFAERDPDAPREAVVDFSLLATAGDASKVQPVLRQYIELTVQLAAPSCPQMYSAVSRAAALLDLRPGREMLDQLTASCLMRADGADSVVRAAALMAR